VKRSKKRTKIILIVFGALLIGLTFVGSRVYRMTTVARDLESQIRYLIENGGSIGDIPAAQAFSEEFLESIFGDNTELLERLKVIMHQGLADEPTLNLGEVAAMMVTYNMTDTGEVSNVVVHAIGGFPLARKKPGMHRSGYFFQQLDPNLWNYGNILIGFMGRDMILFSDDDATTEKQEALLDTLFTGDIMPLVNQLSTPMYYTIVFPKPRYIIPRQLRNHVRAIVVKGSLGYRKGFTEMLLLTPSDKSAKYTYSILHDMELASVLALKTRWGGVERQTLWGPVINPWWAYEIVQALEHSTMKREDTLVIIHSDFGRIMVNVVLKGVERMSRDLAMMRATTGEGLDPREADAALKSRKPLHYWSEPHQWGPDWPIPPILRTNRLVQPSAPEEVKETSTAQEQKTENTETAL